MQITYTGLIHDDPARSTPGYVLISTLESDKIYLLDHSGDVAHQWNVQPGNTNWCYLKPNGNVFINERCPHPQGVALTASGQLSEYNPAGELVWRHVDPWQHHDARRLANGGAVYLAFEDWPEPEKSNITGGIPNSEPPGGPFGEVVREVNEAGDVVWEWSLANLGLGTHPLYRNADRASYGHTNTVFPLANGDYLISAKSLCAIFIVSRATSEVTWLMQDDELSGQHDVQQLENGNLLLFANGTYMPDVNHSQAFEIDLNTKAIVWRYKAKNDPTSFFTPHMGSVQRLPSGNTLICEANKGNVFEVTHAGDIVREFVNPWFAQAGQFGRINWLFRARWYAQNSPEISALGLC